MIYYKGQLIQVKKIKYELLHFQGEWRRAEGKKIFKLPPSKILPDGREHVYYEMWECLNLDTGKVEPQKLPVYIFIEAEDEYLEKDRQDVIDDDNEVTSLLDRLDDWFSGERSKYNFHLKSVNEKHLQQIIRLYELESAEIDSDFKVGIRLRIIQKEHPNIITRRRFKEWGIQFPDLLTKLQQYVYMEGNNLGSVSSNSL